MLSIPDGSDAGSETAWWVELNTLPAMSMAKGRSDFQPVYQPTTLPPDTRGRSYGRPPANPTGQTETPRVLLICRREGGVLWVRRLEGRTGNQ